jgi:hypothetical protein
MATSSKLFPLFAFVSLFGSANAGAVRYAAYHFEITPPSGWQNVEIGIAPPLGTDVQRIATFELHPSKQWTGPTLGLSLVPGIERPADLFDELSHDPSNFEKEGRVTFDPELQLVELTERLQDSDGHDVSHLTALRPATNGIVRVDFFMPYSSTPPQFEPLVRDVLRSLRIDSGFEVSDLKPGQTKPILEDVASQIHKNPTALALIVIGLVGVIGGVVRRRRQPNPR